MAQSNERTTRAKRGSEGGHRARGPRSREAQEVARNSARQRNAAADKAESTRETTVRRETQYGGRTGGSGTKNGSTGASGGKNRKNGNRNGSGPILYVGIGAVVLIAVLCIFLLVNGKKDGRQPTESSLSEEASTEETLAADVIRGEAYLDLSLLPEAKEKLTAAETAGEDSGSSAAESEESGETSAEASSETPSGAMLSLQGKTISEVRDEVAQYYSWNMAIVNDNADVGATVTPTVDANQTTEAATIGDAENPDSLPSEAAEQAQTPAAITVTNEIAVPDLVAEALNTVLSQIESDNAAYTETDAAKTYVLQFDDLGAAANSVAQDASTMWYKMPKGGSIGSYDKANDKFIMEGAQSGFEVDKAALADAVAAAAASGDFSARITVPGHTLSAEEATAASEYKIIGSFTTKTTSNSVRNKNIQLACEAINGTILTPGAEFSFNNVVGQRTEAKGYGAAAAYNEGEVVQEVGGGICQVSTTLYNAVLRAGLKTTKRQSHTFEPSYVTPGYDATVSWGGPDYRFANVASKAGYSNEGSYSIGIRAHYANREVTISIYGRPVLKDGYTFELSSKKVKDIDVVRKLIEPGSDRKPTRGTKGSQWVTNLVIKKNGETVSDELDHNTYYSGHIEYYTDAPAATVPATTAPAETVPQTTAPAETEPLPTDVISDVPQNPEPQYETGVNGGPGVTAVQTTAATEQAVQPGPGETTTAAPAPAPAPTEAPQTTAAPAPAPAPAETAAPVTPEGGSGPISDAPPAL
ncbi:MAG: VanW family protein [Eubacteriales bacterium]|nr:VanW family protein [Eubacteriales bacterium]